MKNPWCKKNKRCHDAFDIPPRMVTVILGGCKFYNVHVVAVNNTPILTVLPPLKEHHPYRLSALFCDSKENLCLKIDKNEWEAYSDAWDIKVVGGTIKILKEEGVVALQIACLPSKGIVIQKLNMYYEGVRILGDEKKLNFKAPGNSVNFELSKGFTIFRKKNNNPKVALRILSNGNYYWGSLRFEDFFGGGTLKLATRGHTILQI